MSSLLNTKDPWYGIEPSSCTDLIKRPRPCKSLSLLTNHSSRFLPSSDVSRVARCVPYLAVREACENAGGSIGIEGKGWEGHG
jgi:hypothetical protein